MKKIKCFSIIFLIILLTDFCYMYQEADLGAKNNISDRIINAKMLAMKYTSISNSFIILFSLSGGIIHCLIFIVIPIFIFARKKQKIVKLVKSKIN